MKQHLDNTRRQLGELGAMAHQTDAVERRILERAETLLGQVESGLDKARAEAMAGDDDAKQRYQDAILERGRLHRVIASARAALGAA